MANSNGQLDTTIEIVTPENIAFQFRVAGPFRRLPAYLLDLMIRGAVLVGLGIVVPLIFGVAGLTGLGVGLFLVIWFAVDWFYGGLFESFWNGQTPGKRILGIRVVSRDGQPINGFQAVLRNVLRAVDTQPFGLCLIGLVTAGMSRRFQRLGDLASRTVVVIDEPWGFRGVAAIVEPEAVRLAGLIPANFQASRTLAKALAAYVSRRGRISRPRRAEIARHLGVHFRERFHLPPNTDLDQLLCAMYSRTFIADRDGGGAMSVQSPFAEPAPSQGRSPPQASSPVMR